MRADADGRAVGGRGRPVGKDAAAGSTGHGGGLPSASRWRRPFVSSFVRSPLSLLSADTHTNAQKRVV